MTDNELVQAYPAGDESAVTATKEKYRHYLYKISFQILGDKSNIILFYVRKWRRTAKECSFTILRNRN